MKTFITILILTVSFNIKSQITYFKIENDKVLHFLSTALISNVTYNILDGGKYDKNAMKISFLSTLTIGVLKEGYDYSRNGNFSLKDLKFSTFGALFGCVTYKVILNFKHKAKGDNSDFENISPIKEDLFNMNYKN